ncbi:MULTISPECIES: sensor histidine kinase [unclassified Streptomyces]|uniref:sensor histidine kinase n=1 Tax=unclassified Streptomyces TaxID=2593676 RepID=UPI002E3464CE|nr:MULTISPECIES: ATP-binding protein [unclassified Streptomyces]
MTAPREHVACDRDELRALFLFEDLTDDQLDVLCGKGHVEVFEPGFAYREGEPARCFFVLLEGYVALYRRVGDEDVELSRTDQPGVHAGAWRAVLGDRVPQIYDNSLRVLAPTRLYLLDAELYGLLMHAWFPMALHLLEGLFFNLKNVQLEAGRREQLLALGSLAAGLTHELNNPAAAAVRANASLRRRIADMYDALEAVAAGDKETLVRLVALQKEISVRPARPTLPGPLEATAREDELADWLAAHDVPDGWELASTFAQAGLGTEWLERVARSVSDPGTLADALRWLHSSADTRLLTAEVEEATTRVSALVTAAKGYAQLDRAPDRVMDVHELLDSTLLVLGDTIGRGVRVVRAYDPALPRVPGRPAELNQVWTNLIGNAVEAMGGHGTLTIRTSHDADWVGVDVCDTGTGVPEELTTRIFEPFFTTKKAGAGAGLGLYVAWRIVAGKHHGDLSVTSEPGDTRFLVRLPRHPPVPSGP